MDEHFRIRAEYRSCPSYPSCRPGSLLAPLLPTPPPGFSRAEWHGSEKAEEPKPKPVRSLEKYI